jgi:hypothetical protein
VGLHRGGGASEVLALSADPGGASGAVVLHLLIGDAAEVDLRAGVGGVDGDGGDRAVEAQLEVGLVLPGLGIEPPRKRVPDGRGQFGGRRDRVLDAERRRVDGKGGDLRPLRLFNVVLVVLLDHRPVVGLLAAGGGLQLDDGVSVAVGERQLGGLARLRADGLHQAEPAVIGRPGPDAGPAERRGDLVGQRAAGAKRLKGVVCVFNLDHFTGRAAAGRAGDHDRLSLGRGRPLRAARALLQRRRKAWHFREGLVL